MKVRDCSISLETIQKQLAQDNVVARVSFSSLLYHHIEEGASKATSLM